MICVWGTERRVDRVYIDAATEEKGSVRIHPGIDRCTLDLINRQGFRDLGVWNPHDDLPDLTISAQFVAFSSGEIARPVRWVCFPSAWHCGIKCWVSMGYKDRVKACSKALPGIVGLDMG